MRTQGAKRSKYTPPIEHELTILRRHKLGGRRCLSLAQCPRWGDCRHQQGTKKNLRKKCEVHRKTSAGDKTQRDATLRPIGDIFMVVCMRCQTDSCHCRDRRHRRTGIPPFGRIPCFLSRFGVTVDKNSKYIQLRKKNRSAQGGVKIFSD